MVITLLWLKTSLKSTSLLGFNRLYQKCFHSYCLTRRGINFRNLKRNALVNCIRSSWRTMGYLNWQSSWSRSEWKWMISLTKARRNWWPWLEEETTYQLVVATSKLVTSMILWVRESWVISPGSLQESEAERERILLVTLQFSRLIMRMSSPASPGPLGWNRNS